MSVTVFVQTIRDRSSWAESKQSILSSDIGWHYYLMEQGAQTDPRDHFLDVMHAMSQSSTEWVLRLEDDVIVNRHIIKNITDWPAKQQESFGAGWLFDAGGTTRNTHDRIYGRVGRDKWHSGQLHCCQAVLLRTVDVPLLKTYCKAWFDANPGVLAQDIALSRAVAVMGKKICIHAPPLVEHLIKYASTLGHANTRSHTTEGAFRLNWRRR